MTFEQLAAIARDWQSRLTPAQVRAGVESLRRQVYVSDLPDAIPLDDAPLKAAIEAAGGVTKFAAEATIHERVCKKLVEAPFVRCKRPMSILRGPLLLQGPLRMRSMTFETRTYQPCNMPLS